jgi:GNAT superfamily N-acetyltransferase
MNTLPQGYVLTDDQAQIDPVAAHAYLTRSYWAKGIPLDIVRRSLENSFVVAVFKDGAQIAMARLVTDWATFAHLADVYVLEAHRGQGLSQAMLAYLQGHSRLQGLRRWMLTTRDAHAVYEKQGWTGLAHPERFMERAFLDLYQ